MRNGFINSFQLARDTKQDLYFCNKKQKYFLLGNITPTKGCCEKVIVFDKHNPIKDILINRILS